MKRLIIIFVLIGFSYFELLAVLPVRNKVRLNEGWEFLKSDLGGIWEAVRPGGGSEKVPIWEKVTLPHCFNAEDAVDPDINYYQGPGWYRTHLSLENPYPNGRIIIELEGAGQKTEVYIYTQKLKSHVGGYDSWYVDITDAVNEFLTSKDAERFKGKVPLIIRCDNSRDLEMIPSDLSDFNLYGGLYRYVNLIYLPEVSIENFEITSSLNKNFKKATLSILGRFYNPQDIKNASLEIRIFEPSGKKIIEKITDILPLGEKLLLETELKNPVLWDVDNPVLYRCEVLIKSNGNETKCSQNFSFRHVEFVENVPLFSYFCTLIFLYIYFISLLYNSLFYKSPLFCF